MQGWVGLGPARADLSTEGLWAFPAGFIESRCGEPRPGTPRPGEAQSGWASLGPATAATAARRASALPAALVECRSGEQWRGAVMRGCARQGAHWRGLATADDLSTEPFGALCWVLRNPDAAWQFRIGFGVVHLGCAQVRLGRSRQAKGQTMARSPSGFPAILIGWIW